MLIHVNKLMHIIPIKYTAIVYFHTKIFSKYPKIRRNIIFILYLFYLNCCFKIFIEVLIPNNLINKAKVIKPASIIIGTPIAFQHKFETLITSNSPFNIDLSLIYSGNLIFSHSKNSFQVSSPF